MGIVYRPSSHLLEYAGEPKTITITGVAADKALNNITLPAYKGTVIGAYLDLECYTIRNTWAGENYISTPVHYQVSADDVTYNNAGSILNDSIYFLAAGIYSNVKYSGDHDIKAYITAGATLYSKIALVGALHGDIVIYLTIPRIRIYFE